MTDWTIPDILRIIAILCIIAFVAWEYVRYRRGERRPAKRERGAQPMTHASTRDNYVRHAIVAGTCPICREPMGEPNEGGLVCIHPDCRFFVPADELAQHLKAMEEERHDYL